MVPCSSIDAADARRRCFVHTARILSAGNHVESELRNAIGYEKIMGGHNVFYGW